MQVDQIMTRSVHFCHTWDKLSDAAQLMWDADCGCVPVIADDGSHQVVGMLTDRDICMAIHLRGEKPDEISVGEVMSPQVRAVNSSAELAEAQMIMSEAQVRRLPVVDREAKLVGMLALADLAREAQRMRTNEHPPITDDEIGDTLCAISASRTPSELAPTA